MLKITILSLFSALAISTVYAIDPKIHLYFGPNVAVSGNEGKPVPGPNHVEHIVTPDFLFVNFAVFVTTDKGETIKYRCKVWDVKDKHMKEDRVLAFQAVEPHILYKENGPVSLWCSEPNA